MDFGVSLVLPFLYFPLFLIPKGCHDYSRIIAIQVLTLKGWHKKHCLLCWLYPISPLQGLIFRLIKYFYNPFIPSGFLYWDLIFYHRFMMLGLSLMARHLKIFCDRIIPNESHGLWDFFGFTFSIFSNVFNPEGMP